MELHLIIQLLFLFGIIFYFFVIIIQEGIRFAEKVIMFIKNYWLIGIFFILYSLIYYYIIIPLKKTHDLYDSQFLYYCELLLLGAFLLSSIHVVYKVYKKENPPSSISRRHRNYKETEDHTELQKDYSYYHDEMESMFDKASRAYKMKNHSAAKGFSQLGHDYKALRDQSKQDARQAERKAMFAQNNRHLNLYNTINLKGLTEDEAIYFTRRALTKIIKEVTKPHQFRIITVYSKYLQYI